MSANFFSAIWPVKNLRPAHALAHALAGAGLFALLTPRYAWAPAPWLLGIAALAALLPDLDTIARVPHRTATHSLAAAALVWIASHHAAPAPIADALTWGYISHIALDLFHGAGVALLWPLPDFMQVAAVGSGALITLAAAAAWIGTTGDAPLYHLWRTPTPTLAVTAAAGDWPPCVPRAGAMPARVVRVIDGDTIIAALPTGNDTVRLLGVNAPEVPHPQYGKPTGEPGGEEATQWLRATLAAAGDIYIAPARGRDKYGRLLAYIIADGHLVNADLLRAGWARLYMESGLSCADTLAEAAAAAQLAGVGIWGGLPTPTPTPTITPTPTPTVGYDYQADLLLIQVERVHLKMTAVAMTATAAPWRYNAAWYDFQIAALTLDESEAWLRYQAHLAAHPPTPTPTPSPSPAPLPEPAPLP